MPAAAPNRTTYCSSTTPLTRAMVMPAETIPMTLPSAPKTGTTAWTSGPMVPLICSVTTLPSRTGPSSPTNFFPMRPGSGWV